MFTDAIDSYYVYTRNRIKTFNSARVVKGLLNAQDWPQKPLVWDAFYLLVLGETPIGRQGYSQYSPILMHSVQWVWINTGSDIVPGVRQANRGDRYRTSQAMKGELLFANSPGYTQKLTWSLNSAGQLVSTPEQVPTEFITWTPMEFHEKLDKDSGIVYGSGAVRITDMTDAITS